MKTYNIIITSHFEGPQANFTVESSEENLTLQDIKTKFQKAITKWITTTESGKQVKEMCLSSINISDVFDYLNEIEPFLKKENIEVKENQIPILHDTTVWKYHDRLNKI